MNILNALFRVWCEMEHNLTNKGELRSLVRHAKRRFPAKDDFQLSYRTPRVAGKLRWLELHYDGLKYLFLLPE